MRSHTEGLMSFKTGAVHCKSSKQKLNRKTSTEMELLGVSKYMSYHIWLMNFLKIQGMSVQKKLLLQDNQSLIKMERNGQNSCTGNFRHIDIHYFFVKDQIESGELDIKYCPTEEMVEDFLAKPLLQGKSFQNFCNILMGKCNMP